MTCWFYWNSNCCFVFGSSSQKSISLECNPFWNYAQSKMFRIQKSVEKNRKLYHSAFVEDLFRPNQTQRKKLVVASMATININPLNLFYLAWIFCNPKKLQQTFLLRTMHCRSKKKNWMNCYQRYTKELIQFV